MRSESVEEGDGAANVGGVVGKWMGDEFADGFEAREVDTWEDIGMVFKDSFRG